MSNNQRLMETTILRPYIDWYKANFAIIFDREGYKWRSIQKFQSSYSANKSDYPNILKNAFSKSENLLNSQSTFSLGMMLDITRFSLEHPETSISGLSLFYDLFEGISTNDRDESILSKISSFREKVRKYVKTYLPDKKHDYQDLHAVSVYLSHRNPDKFYIYRTHEFIQFNKLLNNTFTFKWGKDSNYISYMNMCDQLNVILRTELQNDKGFQIIVDRFIKDDDTCYNDPEYRLLTQDFIYSVISYYNTDLQGEYADQMISANKSQTVEQVSVDELRVLNHPIPKQGKSPSKVDYVVKQHENTRLGKIGEKWVLKYEKAKLTSAGLKHLAKKVVWIAENDDSKGYDIKSYNVDGSEIFIEVKTTNGGPKTPFYISALEMKVNKEHLSKYRLYRLYNFNKEPKLRIIIGDLSKLNPQPTSYIVYSE